MGPRRALSTLALLLLLAAPSGAGAADGPRPTRSTAALFEPGRTLTFHIEVEEVQYTGSEAGPDIGKGRAKMTCRVAATKVVGPARASHVTCDEPSVGQTPQLQGVWLAAAAGVWFIPAGQWPPSVETVETELRVEASRLAAKPKAGKRRVEVEEAEGDEQGCWVVTKRQKVKVWGGQDQQAWCVMEECSMGDEASHTTCWVAGLGPARFISETSGGGFDLSMTAAVEPALPEKVVAWGRKAGEMPAEVRELVERWVTVQNAGDVKGYRGLFAEGFEGIKRTRRGTEKRYDLKAWLKDRVPMIRRGQQVVVRDATATVKGEGAVVRFVQYWSSATYADKGEKELVLKREDGVWRVVVEEMKKATRWDGRY